MITTLPNWQSGFGNRLLTLLALRLKVQSLQNYIKQSLTFEFQEYSVSDTSLITSVNVDTSFDPNMDYLEYFIYDLNGNILIQNTSGYPGYKLINNNWQTFRITDITNGNTSFGSSFALSANGSNLFIGAFKETIGTSIITTTGGIYKYYFIFVVICSIHLLSY